MSPLLLLLLNAPGIVFATALLMQYAALLA